MEQESRFEFVVDEKYENEKGMFTVLSIHRNEMVIRWDSGEEIRTDIELQRNIQARREWEKVQLEKEAQSAAKKRKASAKKAAFEGFKEGDFKNSASGTKWRGRNQLGGAVTHRLPESRFNINSWAFANKPEMHWLDTVHQKRNSGDSRAKFFARLDPETLTYGFSVGRSTGKSDASMNWDNFMQWLAEGDNAATVHAVALENELTIGDKTDSGDKILTPIKGGWRVGDAKKKHPVGKLVDFIGELAGEGDLSLEVAKRKSKKDALSDGKDIALELAGLFTHLIPLYGGALIAG